MRLLMLLTSAVCLSGCYKHGTTPALRPITKISGKVYSVPELGISAIDSVEVPQEQVSAFAVLITPTKPCAQDIDPQMNYHVADVYVQHQDRRTTTLIVRWTGHNPAALSLDDCNYYYGGSDDFPDGARRIIRLLNEYHNRSRK
jgi:hypothetical protein